MTNGERPLARRVRLRPNDPAETGLFAGLRRGLAQVDSRLRACNPDLVYLLDEGADFIKSLFSRTPKIKEVAERAAASRAAQWPMRYAIGHMELQYSQVELNYEQTEKAKAERLKLEAETRKINEEVASAEKRRPYELAQLQANTVASIATAMKILKEAGIACTFDGKVAVIQAVAVLQIPTQVPPDPQERTDGTTAA